VNPAPTPADLRKAERQARLRAYRVLDTPPEPAFEELVRRAQDAVRAPMAWLSFFDGEREWIQARAGVALAHLAREQSPVFGPGEPVAPLHVEDLSLATEGPHARLARELRAKFFCAVPLVAPGGMVLGTLTVLDRIPRSLTAQERVALENLATLAVARLEARLQQAPAAFAAVKSAARSGGDAEARVEHLAREYQRMNELLEEEIGLRRDTEERLRREKEFSDAVLQSLPGAFFLVGPEGEHLVDGARERLRRLLGQAVDQVDVGRHETERARGSFAMLFEAHGVGGTGSADY